MILSDARSFGLVTASLPRLRSLAVCVLAIASAAWFAPSALAVGAGTVSTYPIPGTSAPYGIAAGPDGKIWFADPTYGQIGRMATDGTIVAGDLLDTPGMEPANSITAGPDGDMWAGGAGHVFQIPTNAKSTSDIASDGPHGGAGIATGPDGRLWFTYAPDPGVGANYLGAITTGGSEVDYQVGSPGSPQYISDGIATGSDGELWLGYDDAIARMSTSGVIGPGDVFPLPAPAASVPNELALGPDGNVWFTEAVPAAVGKITPSGQITLFLTPTANSVPFGIAAGPDGRMWFTERDADKIGAIPTDATSSGDITEYPIGAANVGAINIAAGPDGRMWFNETNTGSLGAITTGATTASFKLAVSVTGTGKGTVGSRPAGIDCGSTCQAQFSSGSQVSLTATPTAGSTFAGWSGAGCAGTGTCVVTMSAARIVTATFNAVAAPTGSCALVPKSKRVAVKTHKHSSPRTNPGTVTLIATCNVGARATLKGTVTEHLAKKSGKPRNKLFRLATVHVTLIAGVSKGVVMKVPASVALALRRGTPESAAFTMTIPTTPGTIRVTATVAALKL